MEISKSMNVIIFAFVGGIILSALLLGFRASAMKSAYDSTGTYNVTDSAGVVHEVAASGLSGDTVALLYGIGLGFVWLVVALIVIFELLAMIKHRG